MQKPVILLVAATRFKSIGYIFKSFFVRDREVGGSNPPAPTIMQCEKQFKPHRFPQYEIHQHAFSQGQYSRAVCPREE